MACSAMDTWQPTLLPTPGVARHQAETHWREVLHPPCVRLEKT